MADQWTQLEVLDFSAIEGATTTINAEILETVAAFLDAVATALRVLSAFFAADTDPVKALLQGLVNVLEQSVLDFLQTNVAIAVHLNLNLDTEWRFDPDFTQDNLLPYRGTGVSGWLDDVNASAYDETNVFRPVTDSETTVGGMIIVNGVAAGDSIDVLKSLYDLFTDFEDLKNLLDMARHLKSLDDDSKPLLKLGQALSDDLMHSLIAVREGFEGFADPETYVPRPGNLPIWASIPIASLIPPVQTLFDELRRLIDGMRQPGDAADLLARLASLLAQKADLLSSIAEELQGVIDTLASLVNVLNDSYIIFLPMPEEPGGGFANFVNRARGAENAPDFGSDGIVAGVVVVTTADDPLSHLENFMSLVTGFAPPAETTTQAERLSAMYDDLYEE